MSGEGKLRVYSGQEIEEKLKELPLWRYENLHIVREFETKNWKETVFLFNAIASLAEAHWHHPDVEVSFRKLRVKLTTHEAKGITDRDFNLASEIEKISSLLLKR